jgi:hypothetical protein
MPVREMSRVEAGGSAEEDVPAPGWFGALEAIDVLTDLVDTISATTDEVEKLSSDDGGPAGGVATVDDSVFERVVTGGSVGRSELDGWIGLFGVTAVTMLLVETISATTDDNALDHEEGRPGGKSVGAPLVGIDRSSEELALVTA